MAGSVTQGRKLRKSFSQFNCGTSTIICGHHKQCKHTQKHHTRNNRKILEMQEFKKLSMVQKDAAARLCCYCSVLASMC